MLKKADFHTQKPSTRALQVKGIAEVKTLLQGIIPEKKKDLKMSSQTFFETQCSGLNNDSQNMSASSLPESVNNTFCGKGGN